MIYLVTRQQSLFDLEGVTNIDIKKAVDMVSQWSMIQADSETTGREPHICDLLCFQLGNIEGDNQVIIDCTTENITEFKEILETKYLIFQNAKFDLQFLFKYNIVPTKIYDTMIVEQFLHLGYPSGVISYSLASLAKKYLNIDLDKSIRGDIIWRGLDLDVLHYAAKDVKYLYPIMQAQLKICKERDKNTIVGAKLECDCVPAIAYLEWCGIKLDEEKWGAKMKNDKIVLQESLEKLNNYALNHPKLQKWCKVDYQGDLFTGFNLEPQWTVDWQKKEAIDVVKALGFNTKAISKVTKKESDSIMEKNLKSQKGIDDTFLELYFDYQGKYKVITSFGQGHLNAINPLTGRIHTVFKQLGASSGRMSCGSNQPNIDLAKYKGISPKNCAYPNVQQLPSDEITRSCFVAEKGNNMVSADFSAEESRLGADIYQDKEFLDEFLYRSGDMHSLFAWTVFRKECEDCGCKSVADVKKLAPKWRKAVKAVEFAYMFGAAAPTISQNANCSVEQAQQYINSLEKTFTGVTEFAKKGSKFVRQNGYIVICPITGHRLIWHDHDQWLKRQKEFTPEFWENYRLYHKGTGDEVALKVKHHFQAVSKYDRLARNVVTQGTGAIIMKEALTNLFNWIIEHNLFNEVKLCAAVHDEIVAEYPKELVDFPKILEDIMEKAAAKYCKSLPIPAEASVGNCWIH